MSEARVSNLNTAPDDAVSGILNFEEVVLADVKFPNFNRVFLVGRLTRESELKQAKDGVHVLEARLAVNSPHKDSGGKWQNEVVFIDFVAYEGLADLCDQFLHKGSAVLVEGRIQRTPFTDDKIRIEADRVQFLDKSR